MFVLLTGHHQLAGQNKPGPIFSVTGTVTLDSLTRYVHRISGIRFSFNSTVVNGSKLISFPAHRPYSLDALLQQIKKTTSLYYSFYNGYVIFQDTPPKKKVPEQDPTPANPLQQVKPAAVKTAMQQPRINKASILPQQKAVVQKKVTGFNGKPEEDNSKTELKKKFAEKISTNSYSLLYFTAGDLNKPVLQQSNTVKIQSLEVLPQDSIKAKHKTRPNAHRQLQYGLQWEWPLPLQGTTYYFTGANGKSQPFVFLLPGIFVEKKIGARHYVSSKLLLLRHQFAEQNVLSATIADASNLDTAKVLTQTTLLKTYGFEAGLDYQYHINTNWLMGLGVQYNAQSKALLLNQKLLLRDGTLLQETLATIQKGASEWAPLNNYFISVHASAGFVLKKKQVGIEASLPVTSMAKTVPVKPPAILLYVRWHWH
ncbi:MAG: hypothetical protein JST86_03550 [Bacteroidetes bacterium]|nr:hypothetical protein [Bacteroidota bacterium]